MKEKNSHSTKIILLLFVPIVNNFNFQSEEEVKFIDLTKFKKQNVFTLKREEMTGLIMADYSSGILQQNLKSKTIIINYPKHESHLNSLNIELVKKGQKIEHIILLTIPDYEMITSIKDKYLICPICEKIYSKSVAIKEEKFFVCPQDNEYQFLLTEINDFNEWITKFYLNNTKILVEKFLSEKKETVPEITKIAVDKIEELFSGKLQERVLEEIKKL